MPSADIALSLALGAAVVLAMLALLAWTGISRRRFLMAESGVPSTAHQKQQRSHAADARRFIVTVSVVETVLLVGFSAALIATIVRLSRVIEISGAAIFGLTVVASACTLVVSYVMPAVFSHRLDSAAMNRTARIWRVLMMLLSPLTSPLLKLSDWAYAKTRRRSVEATEREKMEVLGPQAHADKDAFRGMISLGSLPVSAIMQPRSGMATVDYRLPFSGMLQHLKHTAFSRLPVVREQGQPQGVLYVKDVLPYLHEGGAFEWQRLVRPAFVVTEAKTMEALLKDFQKKHVHLALVVNAQGQVSGLVTLEDIIREVMDDINDDAERRPAPLAGENVFVFDGQTPVSELCQVLGLTPDFFKGSATPRSLEGLLKYLRGEMLQRGDVIHYEPFTFTVESVRRKHIKRVRVHVHEQEER